MAKTEIATGNALTKKLYEEKLYRDIMKQIYFEQFLGKSMDSMVYVKEDFTKNKGDAMTFGLRMRLSGNGQTTGILEGNEESLTTYSDTLTLQQYKHAVRYDSDMSVQRAVWNLPAEAKDAITTWGAEKVDSLIMDALESSPTCVFYKEAGTLKATSTAATATAAITDADTFGVDFLQRIRPFLETGNNGSQPRIEPLRVPGLNKKYYVFLTTPNVGAELKRNSEYAQAVREAEVKGKDNSFFTGSIAIIDNFVIHTHENVTGGVAGSAVSAKTVEQGYILGAQALCMGWAKRPYLVSKDFGYDEEHGDAIKMIFGVTKARFNNKDYGTVAVYSAATNSAGITIS